MPSPGAIVGRKGLPEMMRVKVNNSVINLSKLTQNNPNLELVNIKEYAIFCLIPSVHF